MAKSLEPLRTTLGDYLSLPPDLKQSYKRVTTQVYPLPADIDKLQTLCDAYLNFENDPNLPANFRVAAPWVFMQVCNYQQIELQIVNQGFFSQIELAFGIPVEWYDVDPKSKKRTFRDWALVYPYIYVDNPLSMGGGREVYGWAKAGIKPRGVTAPQLIPSTPELVIGIDRTFYNVDKSLPLTIQPSPDAPPIYKPFVEVYHARPFLTGLSGVRRMIGSVPRAVRGYLETMSAIFDTANDLISGPMYKDASYRSLLRTMSRSFKYVETFAPKLFEMIYGTDRENSYSDEVPMVQIATRKEFRDVADSKTACYQALIGSRMGIEEVVDGGILFDPLSADPGGGIEIRFFDTIQPTLVESLGLQRATKINVGSQKHPEYAMSLHPVMPFWSEMNLTYGKANVQCWRTSNTTEWSVSEDPPPAPDAIQQIPPHKVSQVGSGSGVSLEGPLEYKSINARFFHLQADRDAVRAVISDYLKNDFFEFIGPDDGMLWLLVSDYVLDKPGHDDRAFTFLIPVKWREIDSKAAPAPAMVPLYSFVGADWDFITENEVYGRFALKSDLVSPPNTWLKVTNASSTDKLLEISSFLFPDPKQAAPVAGGNLSLFRIHPTPGPHLNPGPPRTDITMQLIDVLGLTDYVDKTFQVVALKQIIDATQANCAAYQSIVVVDRQLSLKAADWNVQVDISNVEIRATEYLSVPIVSKLKLDHTLGGSDIVLTPLARGAFTGSLRDVPDTAQTWCWRAGNGSWNKTKP